MFSTYAGQSLIHILAMSFLTLVAFSNITANSKSLEHNRRNVLLLFYAVMFTLFSGLRPYVGFVDTSTYVFLYEQMEMTNQFVIDDGEWFFRLLMYVFSRFTDAHTFFLFVAIVYVWFQVRACDVMTARRSDLLLLGCMSAFSFQTYAVNGIRNGMACAIVVLALSLVLSNKSKRNLIIAGILSFFAYNIHHSVLLPIACCCAAMYYKNTRNLIVFWFLSIGISLVAGSQVEAFFSGLGFDDRMESYSQNHEYDDLFSKTGFRWDFLLYSFMPILLGYYIVYKRKINDEKYNLLLNTYILCNSFWVMVIRVGSSNRFAYLSWFLYSFVLIYPLLNLPVFERNHRSRSAMIILAHTGFTVVMWLIGK